MVHHLMSYYTQVNLVQGQQSNQLALALRKIQVFRDVSEMGLVNKSVLTLYSVTEICYSNGNINCI